MMLIMTTGCDYLLILTKTLTYIPYRLDLVADNQLLVENTISDHDLSSLDLVDTIVRM
jgi:hypothetical protein